VEWKNFKLEIRTAEGKTERFSEIVAELSSPSTVAGRFTLPV